MAPKRQPRGQQPQQPPRPRPRSRRPASERDTLLARKEVCIAALQKCRNGADRAETAFNELIAKHNQELDKEYQLHRADQGALRSALTKLCGKHKISYTAASCLQQGERQQATRPGVAYHRPPGPW